MPEKAPLPPESQAAADDQIIGLAFRWSMVVLLLIALLAAGVVWYVKHRPTGGRVQLTRLSVPVRPEQLAAEIPEARFRDITAEAGIRFVHNNGAYGDKLLP